MNIKNKKTKLDETKPETLASALLIIGIIVVCSFVLYSIIFYIVAGRAPPPYILLSIFLCGIGVVYGSFRTVRGSSVTKQLVKDQLNKTGIGAIAGSAVAFVVILCALVTAASGNWVVGLLIIAIPGALFFGISAGSIGGLILGNIWKNNKAPFVGGAIAGAIPSFLFSYPTCVVFREVANNHFQPEYSINSSTPYMPIIIVGQPPTEKYMKQEIIFISYSRVNSDFAVRLSKDLDLAGINAWIDQSDIPTGARWDDTLQKAIDDSSVFLVLLSPESTSSQNVKDEVGYAIDNGETNFTCPGKALHRPASAKAVSVCGFHKQSV